MRPAAFLGGPPRERAVVFFPPGNRSISRDTARFASYRPRTALMPPAGRHGPRRPDGTIGADATLRRWYAAEVAPRRGAVARPEMARAIGVSRVYARALAGGKVPHPRHFAALAAMAGSGCSRPHQVLGAKLLVESVEREANTVPFADAYATQRLFCLSAPATRGIIDGGAQNAVHRQARPGATFGASGGARI